MSNFQEWNSQVQNKANPDEGIIKCTKCSCEWFEQVEVNRFKANHTVILGQQVPAQGPQQFVLLRCIKCNDMYLPNVIIQAQDTATKLYNGMLDQIEK